MKKGQLIAANAQLIQAGAALIIENRQLSAALGKTTVALANRDAIIEKLRQDKRAKEAAEHNIDSIKYLMGVDYGLSGSPFSNREATPGPLFQVKTSPSCDCPRCQERRAKDEQVKKAEGIVPEPPTNTGLDRLLDLGQVMKTHNLIPKSDLDSVYRERNQLVAAISKLFPSCIIKHEPIRGQEWDPEWTYVVLINLPTGQCTWHIHEKELELFEHLNISDREMWDGHSTAEKYDRLNSLPLAHSLAALAEAPESYEEIHTIAGLKGSPNLLEIVGNLGGTPISAAYLCRCPAHIDKTPSLLVWDDPAGIPVQLHCLAGCSYASVWGAYVKKFDRPIEEPQVATVPQIDERSYHERQAAIAISEAELEHQVPAAQNHAKAIAREAAPTPKAEVTQ